MLSIKYDINNIALTTKVTSSTLMTNLRRTSSLPFLCFVNIIQTLPTLFEATRRILS